MCGGVTLWVGREVTRGRSVADTKQTQRKGEFLCLVQSFEVQNFCFGLGKKAVLEE